MLFGLALSIIVSVEPALQKIAQDFSITKKYAHSLINYGLLGYAIGPLLAGPIGNLFGRKPTIFVGIIIAILGLVLKLFAYYKQVFVLFILGHFISVFGGAICLAVVYTIIHDFYYFNEARKILSFVVAGFLLVPGVMTFLCGFITQKYHWIDIQYLSIAFCGVLSFFAMGHPETHQVTKPRKIHIGKILKSYGLTIKNPYFLCFSILVGFSISMFYLFISEGPVISFNSLKLSPEQFGYFGLIPYIGGTGSLLITGKLSHRISVDRILLFSLISALFLNLIFLVLFLFGYINIFTLFFFSFLIVALAMPINVSGVSMMHHYVHDRSNSSAILVSVFIIISMVFVYISGALRSIMGPTVYPFMLLAISIFLFINYRISKVITKESN